MSATGESGRVSDFDFSLAWSPNGEEIVFGTAVAWDPAAAMALDSQLWLVNASSGGQRRLTNASVLADTVQPNWSPHGHPIARWAVDADQRDVRIVSADGTYPVAVTQDALCTVPSGHPTAVKRFVISSAIAPGA
jgi:hypothetical protein